MKCAVCGIHIKKEDEGKWGLIRLRTNESMVLCKKCALALYEKIKKDKDFTVKPLFRGKDDGKSKQVSE